MARWLGVVVVGDAVTIVDAEVPDSGPIVIQADETWSLQKGARPKAYGVLFTRLADYARSHSITRAVAKESAVSLGGTKKAHLLSAELRGVVLCALASCTTVSVQAKATLSKSFGSRKVDEYLTDTDFWTDEVTGKLRSGSREAALQILAAR